MNDKKIIVISGPSGVGKTTLYQKILSKYPDKIAFSISATTREKRYSERDSIDYYFISNQEFEDLISKNAFIEWAHVHNNFYGTLKSEIERICNLGKHCLLDLDVQGSLNIRRIFKEKAVLIFIMPPSIEVLESRLRQRGFNDECSLKNRLKNACKEIEKKDLYDFLIRNETLESATIELINIIHNIIEI